MNILITGANGQLGNEMRVLSADNGQHRWFFTDVAELDITDREAIRSFVRNNCIGAIVNCAAYTNVDRAEQDEHTAFLINATAAENLAVVAAEAKAKLVHISTDYVFDGNSCIPYKEDDTPNPLTAYGRTKLAGERLVHAACPWAVIIRTAWLYSSFGNNFVKTMLRLGKERDSLSVVYDQIGTPTYAADLARAIMVVIDSNLQHLEPLEPFEPLEPPLNLFHFTNLGVCSWYDFALEIHRLAGVVCDVKPIRSEQYVYKTPRPHYSVLDKQRIQASFAIRIPHWTESLAACIRLLEEQVAV